MLSWSVLSALVWEQWRLSRLELLVRTSMCAAGIGLLALAGPLDAAAQQVLRGVLTFLISFAALFSASWTNEFDSRQLGFSFRLGFTRPVATRWLVIVPVAYALLGSIAFFTLGCMAVYWAVGLRLPWLGPLAITLCSVCLFIAGAWSSTRLDGRISGLVLSLTLVLSWLGIRHALRHESEPLLLSIGQAGYFDLSWLELAALVGVSSSAVLWTIHVVDRQRHGESLGWSRTAVPPQPRFPLPRPEPPAELPTETRLCLKRGLTFSGEGQPPFQTEPGAQQVSDVVPRALSFKQPLLAQLWFESRSCLPLVPLGSVLLPAALLAFLSVNLQWHLAPRAWLGAMFVIPVLVQLLASDTALGLTRQPGGVWLSSFVATRPLRCDEMISIKLLTVFAWSLLALLSTLGFAVVHVLLSGQFEPWQELWLTLQGYTGSVQWSWWWLAAVSAVSLFFTSTCSLLALGLWMARFPRPMLACAYGILAHIGLLAWDASHGWSWMWLWHGLGLFWPLVVWVISLTAIAYVLRRGVVGYGYASCALALWSCWIAALSWLLVQSQPAQPLPLTAYWWLSAYCIGSLAAAALAPWGLSLHRHR